MLVDNFLISLFCTKLGAFKVDDDGENQEGEVRPFLKARNSEEKRGMKVLKNNKLNFY